MTGWLVRPHLTLFFGIFCVMALSNAIVPVLPSYGYNPSVHGLIYAAYFLGAFLLTLPAGILADRFGPLPLLRLGLALTVISGLALTLLLDPAPVIIVRFIEGFGAGLFVAAAMCTVNSHPHHVRMSGWLMASLNAGLVLGLIFSGWIAAAAGRSSGGIFLFACMALVPAVCSFFTSETAPRATPHEQGIVILFMGHYRWIWYSSIVLIGITGVLTSLYPQFSRAPSDLLGTWIAGMSIATIAAVIIYSRTTLQPIPAIRWSALLMAGGVALSFFTPAGLLVIGALAGIVMISQMAFLADIRDHQGVAMGLFSTTSYLGMAILPAAAGFIAGSLGNGIAFLLIGCAALSVFATIGRCPCTTRTAGAEHLPPKNG